MSTELNRFVEPVKPYLPRPLVAKMRTAVTGFTKWRLQNEVRNSLPRFEQSAAQFIRIRYIARVAPAKKILCFPQFPHRAHSVLIGSVINGFLVTRNMGGNWDIAFNYHDRTYRAPLGIDGVRVVNGQSTDVSKKNVQRVCLKVFGYSAAVDPLAWVGEIVIKSNFNARHDGRRVAGPLADNALQDDVVYERFVNTMDRDGWLVDYRTVVMDNRIPYVYVKRRRPENAFVSSNTLRSSGEENMNLDSAENVFSGSEIDGILGVAREMGVDYGEMDILRGSVDGAVYIVDVNNTPIGPPSNIPENLLPHALWRQATAFREFVENRAGAR